MSANDDVPLKPLGPSSTMDHISVNGVSPSNNGQVTSPNDVNVNSVSEPFSSSVGATYSVNGTVPSSAAGKSLMVNKPSFVEHGKFKFMIMDAPTDSNIASYIEALEKKSCKWVVRACEPTYDVKAMERRGIKVMDIPFADGDSPPEKELKNFLALVKSWFDDPMQKDCYIAVHCVAGLGRAPVLVTLALIESGMTFQDAVALVRRKRRGAINQKQLKYVESYKANMATGACCVIA